MITKQSVDQVLPVVADSWEQLRAGDVYRLIEQAAWAEEARQYWQAAFPIIAGIIQEQRPDLSRDVAEALSDLESENGWC